MSSRMNTELYSRYEVLPFLLWWTTTSC